MNDHKLSVEGMGTILKWKATSHLSEIKRRWCLFNTFSNLLSGRQTYNAIIKVVICQYISNPIKYPSFKSYLPSRYRSGREYITSSNMRQFNTWGTEIEILVFAQIVGFDVFVYTKQREWARYLHSTDSECWCKWKTFYISNESGCHFDPVTRN